MKPHRSGDLELSPGVKKFLQKLGVNTTRLQWKLYEWERKKDAPAGQTKLPAQLRWMRYSHKFCPECHGLVDRSERVCPACGAQLPTMAIYRLLRAIGLVLPAGGAGVTFGFLGVMTLLYLVSIFRQGPSAIMAPTIETIFNFGGMEPVTMQALHEYWRALSFGLFHGGLIHIGFNSVALVQVGPAIEGEIGSKRMLVLITLAQITSAIAFVYVGRGVVVGASGWLFGLIGFGVSYYHRRGGSSIYLRNFFVQWAMYGFVFGLLMRGVSNTAHFGGFAGGLILGLTADVTPARRTLWTGIWSALVWPCLILWGATLVIVVRSIIRG